MSFVKVDDELCRLLLSILRENDIYIDCGAGEGVLQTKMPVGRVMSIDLFPPSDSPHVIKFDSTQFEFCQATTPLFLRPCHSDFVAVTLRHAFAAKARRAVYVGLEKNIERDIGAEFRWVSVDLVDGWTGAEGERVWRILPHADSPLRTFYKVRTPFWTSWCEKVWRRGEDHYVGFSGGGSPLPDGAEIVETVEAHDFDELDWHGTFLDEPDSSAGWVDPDGTWYGCDREHHDLYVQFMLKMTVGDVEERGWCRVLGPPGSALQHESDYLCVARRLTAEQRNTLSLRGYAVSGDD
jgi:hypothetical protein